MYTAQNAPEAKPRHTHRVEGAQQAASHYAVGVGCAIAAETPSAQRVACPNSYWVRGRRAMPKAGGGLYSSGRHD